MNGLPSSLSLLDAVYWTYLTIRRDWRHRRPAPRPLSRKRIVCSLRPSVQRPLFVVGAPRSGTTFLGRCVGALPSVSYHFEPMATKSAAEHVYSGSWDEQEAAAFYRIVYRNLLRWRLEGDLRFAEKTPRNCFLIAFLHRTFPNARFIHILRDGRDAALSHSKKPWLRPDAARPMLQTGSHRFGVHPRFWVEPERREEFRSTSTFHRCIWAWRRHVETACEALHALPDDRHLRIRYETFVRHPHHEAERLVNFLAIRDNAARAAVHAVAARAHADSVGTWRAELTSQQRRTATQEAGPLLQRLGYLPLGYVPRPQDARR